MSRRRQWWNSLDFESAFKRRQVQRVVLLACVYVGISTICLGVMYSIALGPLTRAEMPLALRFEVLRDQGGIPGLSETLLIWATLMTALSVSFAVAAGLYLSHKLAGPLYRFKQELRRVANGDAARHVHLRRGDEDFADVASALNAALERVYRDEQVLRQRLEQAETDLAELRRGVLAQVEDPDALRRLLAKAAGEA